MLQETSKNIQIYGTTELHVHKNVQDPEVAISGYSFVRKDRAKGFGRWDGLLYSRRSDLQKPSVEALWIEIFFRSLILFCCV